MRHLYLSLLSGLLLLSCSRTTSDNVKTSGFYATIRVAGSSTNTATVSCSAQFQVGGSTGTYLDLTGGDTVTCNGNSMTKTEFAGIVTYSASVTYSVGSTYTVTLTRSGESPYTSSVTLPEAVTVLSPANASSFQKGTQRNYSWTPSSNASDYMRITLDYVTSSTPEPCPYGSNDDSAPENGSGAFSTTQTIRSPNVAGTCSGKITFSRYRDGTLASGLTGTVMAVQTTTITQTITD